MKLTETALRKIIREELIKEMHFGKEKMESAKEAAIGAAMATLFASPMILRAFLQAHPDMLHKLEQLVAPLMKEEKDKGFKKYLPQTGEEAFGAGLMALASSTPIVIAKFLSSHPEAYENVMAALKSLMHSQEEE